MFSKYLTRRDLIKFGSFSLLSLLSSCGSAEKKIKIILENSFYPKAFQDAIPNSWQIENINIEDFQRKKKFREISDTELTLVNDGWLNKIDFNDFIGSITKENISLVHREIGALEYHGKRIVGDLVL